MIENVMTYLWILAFAFATMMTIIGILRWVANKEKRENRLTIISICSFVVLVVMLLSGKWDTISGVLKNSSVASGLATELLINISKITIKLLLIIIIAFLLIIVFIAALLIVYSGRAIIHTILIFKESDTERLKQELQKKAEEITVLLKNPVFIVSIAGGILALYLILPLVMGENTESIAKCWMNGVGQIVQFCTNNISDNFASNLSAYSLIFILILGIGYGVGNILFEIIKERFEKKIVFLSEYSNSIGLLAVGVSILYLISSKGIDFSKISPSELVVDFLESFVLVVFVIALGILTLEIVRLLMDLREKMFRREARYLFVLLVGLCTVIIVKAFSIFYNAISSILGRKNMQLDNAEEKIQKIYDHILEKVAQDMAEEIDINNRADGEVPYNSFKERITKK